MFFDWHSCSCKSGCIKLQLNSFFEVSKCACRSKMFCNHCTWPSLVVLSVSQLFTLWFKLHIYRIVWGFEQETLIMRWFYLHLLHTHFVSFWLIRPLFVHWLDVDYVWKFMISKDDFLLILDFRKGFREYVPRNAMLDFIFEICLWL